MDNAPVHSKKALRVLLEKHGHTLLPLPPYSHDFNPIEKTFGAMKKRREGLPIETTVEALVMYYF
jgi:transposase